jgi:hypothetical protein
VHASSSVSISFASFLSVPLFDMVLVSNINIGV